MEEGLTDMDWLPRSPDLNVIENAWNEISRGRQFDSVEHLREALYYEWDKLELSYVRKLIKPFPRWLKARWDSRGGPTKY